MRTILDLLNERVQIEEQGRSYTDADLARALGVAIEHGRLYEGEETISTLEKIIAIFGGPSSDFALTLRDHILAERPNVDKMIREYLTEQELHKTRTLISRDEKTGEMHAEQVPAAQYDAIQRQRAEEQSTKLTWSDTAGDVIRYFEKIHTPDIEKGNGWLNR